MGASDNIETLEAWMEFVCVHCGAKALRIVAVVDKTVTVECLACGKKSTFEHQTEPAPVTKAAH